VLADIRRLGLKNGDGQPVTNEGSLRSTWSRVRRDKRREAEEKQRRAAERRKVTNDPPPVVSRTVVPVLARPQTELRTAAEQNEWLMAEIMQRSGKGRPPTPLQFDPVPREVIEEKARKAAERRPDLFPNGPDVTRYKLLKGRRDV
jgi:hypothetical protein